MGRRILPALTLLLLAAGCGGGGGADDAAADDLTEDDIEEDVLEDAEPDAPDDGPGDAGEEEWGNPGCAAAVNVVEQGFTVEVVVDLARYEDGEYEISERATVTAPAAGEAVSLFGIDMDVISASHPYRYEDDVMTFCTGPFDTGDEVIVEAHYVAHEASIPMGLRRWTSEDETVLAVGPSQEPYYAPTWLLVPQSTHALDPVHDDSPAVHGVDITVIAPDETWTVMGPGGPADRDGTAFHFALDTVQPIYDISFAASPLYEVFDVGTTAGGVRVVGAVTPERRAAAEACFPAALTTIEWMVANVGPWEWGDVLTLVEIPDFGGAMEHTTVMWFDSETIQDAPEGEQIVVHETVHHWWGNSVRFADWPHFWLAEGFDEWHTNFNVMGELLTPEGFDELRSLYREYAAEVSYPFAAGMPLPGPLRFDDDQDVMMQWMTSMNLFYIYGAVFLEMVDQRLRRDFSTDLNTLLSLWYDEKRLDEATTEEFLAFLGEQTSDTSTWEALFDDWVYRTPAPTLELSDYSFTGTEASVTLTRVDGADQDMPGLEVVFASGTDTYPTTVDLTSGTESITATATADAEPDGIIVDPGVFYILRLATAPGWSGPAVGTGTP